MHAQAALLATPLVALVLTAAPAAALDDVPNPYADHVVHCAQDMGFTGSHNPGVHHQGFSGWQPHDC